MKLQIRTGNGQLMLLNVRLIEGERPTGQTPVYALLDDSGLPTVLHLDITIGKQRSIEFFDCIAVDNHHVFAFRWIAAEQGSLIGYLVAGGALQFPNSAAALETDKSAT